MGRLSALADVCETDAVTESAEHRAEAPGFTPGEIHLQPTTEETPSLVLL